jgi:hypothetical protein
MAVVLNAAGTAATGAATTTGFTEGAATITIGAISNSVLGLLLNTSADVSATLAVHWDTAGTNQLMTQAGTKIGESDNLGWCYLFGLIAPTTGGKLLKVAWTTISASYTYCLIAFNGADQGSVAGTFRNFISGNPATATSNNVAYPPVGTPAHLNAPVNDMGIFCAASNASGFATSTGGVGQTGTFLYGLNTNVSGGGIYIAGAGASTNCAVSALNLSQPACWAACDIAAVGTVAGGLPNGLNPIFGERPPSVIQGAAAFWLPNLQMTTLATAIPPVSSLPTRIIF